MSHPSPSSIMEVVLRWQLLKDAAPAAGDFLLLLPADREASPRGAETFARQRAQPLPSCDRQAELPTWRLKGNSCFTQETSLKTTTGQQRLVWREYAQSGKCECERHPINLFPPSIQLYRGLVPSFSKPSPLHNKLLVGSKRRAFCKLPPAQSTATSRKWDSLCRVFGFWFHV